MTDSEYMEMKRLLDSLTDGADTLRVVFQTKTVEDVNKSIRTGGEITTREIATDEAKSHPDFKIRYSFRDVILWFSWHLLDNNLSFPVERRGVPYFSRSHKESRSLYF